MVFLALYLIGSSDAKPLFDEIQEDNEFKPTFYRKRSANPKLFKNTWNGIKQDAKENASNFLVEFAELPFNCKKLVAFWDPLCFWEAYF